MSDGWLIEVLSKDEMRESVREHVYLLVECKVGKSGWREEYYDDKRESDERR